VKTKTALIAIIVVVAAAAGGLVMQNQAQEKLRQENADLHQQLDQIGALQAENERLSNQLAQASAPQLSQDQTRELVKLRNEVAFLRNQKSKLQSQNGELESLREENRKLKEQPGAPATPARPTVDPEQAKNACINNLRIIEAAKQQCKVQLNLSITDTPTVEQLLPYLGPGAKELPRCPMGGTYNIGIIGVKAACSIPGHVLE
jgi:hypothetical protein